MAISKIILNGVTQMDLTGDTVVADKLLSSYTAHGADGEPITGTSTAIVPSGTKSITANGTGIDVAQYASVDVAVSGASPVKTKTGTYKPTQTYNTTGNRAICTMSDIGFTPSRFILELDDKANTAKTQYMIVHTAYHLMGSGKAPARITIKYSNSSGTLSITQSAASWTTQSNAFLYTDGTTVYFRTTSSYILSANVIYMWTAYE